MDYAIVFPGQGSQSMGMLSDLAMNYPIVQQTFEEASQVLGYDQWQLVQAGPEDQLNSTEYTQPAMLSAGIAVWRVWQAVSGPKPRIMAGHSLGEYSALVAAQVLTFTDAVKLVAERGRLMQQAVPEGQGAMAAIIGLSAERVVQICADISGETIVSGR